MKVLGVSGSPRKGGNTEQCVQAALDVLGEQGIETELLSLAGRQIKPCTACGGCAKAPEPRESSRSGIFGDGRAGAAIIDLLRRF